MVRIDPSALAGTSATIRGAIERIAGLPEAQPVPSTVPRKAQAAVAAVLFQAPGRAYSKDDVGPHSAINVSDKHGAERNGHSQPGESAGSLDDDAFEPELHVLCTTRAMHLSSHPGQASLPGGKCDHGDKSVADTAFRETCEEIGLHEDSLETGECVLLGTMRPYLSKTALLVHPAVFWLPPKTASKVLASLYASPDEVSALWSFPLRAILSSEEPRQIVRQMDGMANMSQPQVGEPLMKLSDPSSVDRHRPPQEAFRTYSDVPWLLEGAYRLHRFRSTHQLIKGLTADVLMNLASHAYQGTPFEGPKFPVFSPSQASWDDCVAYIVTRNVSGAPRLTGRWGDGESGDSYGSVEKFETVVGHDWSELQDQGIKSAKQRNREEDERLTRRRDPTVWSGIGDQAKQGNGFQTVQH